MCLRPTCLCWCNNIHKMRMSSMKHKEWANPARHKSEKNIVINISIQRIRLLTCRTLNTFIKTMKQKVCRVSIQLSHCRLITKLVNWKEKSETTNINSRVKRFVYRYWRDTLLWKAGLVMWWSTGIASITWLIKIPSPICAFNALNNLKYHR